MWWKGPQRRRRGGDARPILPDATPRPRAGEKSGARRGLGDAGPQRSDDVTLCGASPLKGCMRMFLYAAARRRCAGCTPAREAVRSTPTGSPVRSALLELPTLDHASHTPFIVRTLPKNRSTRRPVFGGYKHGDPGRTDRERTSLCGSAVASGTSRHRQYRARIVAVIGVLSLAFRSWTAVRTLRCSYGG